MTRTLILMSTFLSAFLLFIIQPLYAKYLLPFFGGTSSVWTISVFFYSMTLLLGYLYASLLTQWPSHVARYIHGTLLVLAAILLAMRWFTVDSPLLVEAVYHQAPALSVLLTLLLGVGLPVLLLASTSVLVQYLYARYTDKEPYALFAISNAGSLLGLAAYPFIFEPFTALPLQSAWWTIGFVGFLVMLLVVWWQVDVLKSAVKNVVKPTLHLGLQNPGRIIFLSAIPTFLLAAATEYLSKGIASFPLLWIIPLMLYLISFIIAFGNRTSPIKRVPLLIVVLASIIPVFAVVPVINTSAAMYLFGFTTIMVSFFFICTYFHRQVYNVRPRVADLGVFYVYMTLGGALGSGIVGLLLPLVLNDQIEMYFVFGLLAIYFAFAATGWLSKKLPKFFVWSVQGMVIFVSFLFVWSSSTVDSHIVSDRNFYGTLKVVDTERLVEGELIPVRAIVNGATNHGMQALDERYENTAASYYGPDSGIDIAMRSFIERGERPRVNVVGLGAGMMNAYCEDIESISYTEINPAVEILARKYFTYLDMCPDKTTVVTGDGRLILEDQVAAGTITYDVIMMDAFTDDAIPSHLLTTEAFTNAYQPLMSKNAVLAFHISNKYLNLYPPIVGMARNNGYEVVVVRNTPDGSNALHMPTVWVLVTQESNVENLLSFAQTSRYAHQELVWTDYRSSVLSVLSLEGSGSIEWEK